MQKKAGIRGDKLSIPKAQRRAPVPPIAVIAQEHPDRNAAMVAAYATGGYSYREIAEYFGVHLATVGRIVRSRLPHEENCPYRRGNALREQGARRSTGLAGYGCRPRFWQEALPRH